MLNINVKRWTASKEKFGRVKGTDEIWMNLLTTLLHVVLFHLFRVVFFSKILVRNAFISMLVLETLNMYARSI